MSFSVVGSVNHLVAEYRRFLLSTYRLADPRLREQFGSHIKQADVLVKGPYVTLANDFAREHTLKQLHDLGVGHKDLQRLKWSFGEKELFLHQEQSLRRVQTLERNVVVKTGTGSGKTEAFMLAVMSGVLRMRAEGVKGTKAILLYPMNALANDQLGRLRTLIRDSGVGVTFAMYTGESESVAATLGEPVEGNEFIRRTEIREQQPDVLLTNYKELEFLLVRKEDRTLFCPSLRFLVLDEIHSYRGALATEIACLIRRLKARAGVGDGKLRCIGTSATVSKDAGGDEALAEFAASLFGEPFSREDVIGETLVVKQPPIRTYNPPPTKLPPEEIQTFGHEDDAKLAELVARITGQSLSSSGSMPQKIRSALEGNHLVALLERECREPRSLGELIEVLKTSLEAAKALTDQELRTLIEAYLLVGSVGTEKDPPSLRPKLHTFFQGVYDVGLCMNPACRMLVRDGSETCPKCQSAVRPAALCRTCGQDFVKVRFDEADPTKTHPNDEFSSDEDTGFITPCVHVEQVQDGEDEDGDENGGNARPNKRQSHTKARLKLLPKFVCHQTGRVHEEMPSGSAASTVTVQQVMRGRGNTCPVCNSTYTKGDILTLLRSGAASSNSVLATHHLDKLPAKERKLLIFADNRQEAAHQAGYMGDRHRQFAVRHAIEQVVRDTGASGLALNIIAHKLLEKFQDMGLVRRKLTSDEQKWWRKALEYEAAGEFCRATHQRISLENLALVEIQYEFLDQLTDDSRFKGACERDGAKRETAFKEGNIETLVCSPTLELGVDIGDLLTVLLRNCPPAPANYLQRAGRAGRTLRIGFVSTFCGAGQHDRHCFDDPAWLVRGEFRPPTVKLDNGRILERHARSFVLEELSHEFPRMMAEFVDDLDRPSALTTEQITGLLEEVKTNADALVAASLMTFGKHDEVDQKFFSGVVQRMPEDVQRTLSNWFDRIKRIFEEFEFYRRITADRQAKQKAASRERAYRELTTDNQTAYTLNYLSNDGLLPSYQFPTDTFSLEPGVNDTPTLRRPAWVALFEFAPGNLVYANGHKLKSIRAYFEGRNRAAAAGTEAGHLEASGRVRPFCFCSKCGFASEEVVNSCPHCDEPNPMKRDVAFIESFEAEQSTQITSAEEARQRVYFERKENLVRDGGNKAIIHPYPFSHLEYRKHSRLLVSNWGKKRGMDGDGEMFELCPSCGKHRPAHMTSRETERWDEDHAKRCNGRPRAYVLGYAFSTDALVLPVAKRLIPDDETQAFCRTLGTALVAGAAELLELEADEIAFFSHPEPDAGATITFYETVPGGAGYLTTLAARLPEWAKMSVDRLFAHECSGACYGCLKSYRNQPFHHLLNKNLVRDALFQFSTHERLGDPFEAAANQGLGLSNKWIEGNVPAPADSPTKDTVIERRLFEAIANGGRLPAPVKQREFRSADVLVTVADFAYEAEKIAIYCDGFAFHGMPENLAADAQKRNHLQSMGWMVLTFWGHTILRNSERCEEQIWRVFTHRRTTCSSI